MNTMKREIEFKAYIKRTGEIVDVQAWFAQGKIIYKSNDVMMTLVSKDEYELLEFIGLKDKDDEKIYEGYIVESESHSPNRFEVKFIEGAFCAWYEGCMYPIDISHFYPSTGCQLKVIGNKYQNPDLM